MLASRTPVTAAAIKSATEAEMHERYLLSTQMTR